MPFFCEKRIFWGKIPSLQIFFSFLDDYRKRDGKEMYSKDYTKLAEKLTGNQHSLGKLTRKALFQKFPFSRSKTGNFKLYVGVLENSREGPYQAKVFLSSFWFFGGFRSSRFHFENNLFHLLLISMLFVWFRYYCCSYFWLCDDDDDGFPIRVSMQHIAVGVSLRTHIRVIVEVWLGFLCLRG